MALSLPNLERVLISWTNDNSWSDNIKTALHSDFCAEIRVKILLKTFIASPKCKNQPYSEKNILKVFVKKFHINMQLRIEQRSIQHKVVFLKLHQLQTNI